MPECQRLLKKAALINWRKIHDQTQNLARGLKFMGYPDKCGDAAIHGWLKLHSRPPRLHTDKE